MNLSLPEVFAANAVVVAALMFAVWGLSLVYRDASLVDRYWGLGFVLVGWATLLASDGFGLRQYIMVALVSVWGLRLSAYITWRNWGDAEDPRYQAMRKRHGAAFPWISLFTVFLLQGILMWIISTPVQVGIAAGKPDTLTVFDGIGVILWLVGIFFEAVGDAQLARFKADPANKGKVMDRGLWRYTRHPNYFGDCMVWWGIFVMALSVPLGWATVAGPVIMTVLLLKVSGVALLEKDIRKRRPEYEDYVRRTSAFIPCPPKSDA